jgi:hypothetical protein
MKLLEPLRPPIEGQDEGNRQKERDRPLFPRGKIKQVEGGGRTRSNSGEAVALPLEGGNVQAVVWAVWWNASQTG